MSSQSTPTRIPMLVIGVTRRIALQVTEIFTNTPYTASAVLDQTESPPEFKYSPTNLGVVLNALNPRPRALVTGNAIPDDFLPEIQKVWDDYVRRWDIDGVWVALSRTHPSTGPPPEGMLEELIGQLEGKFGVPVSVGEA